mmetsp:Transcript_33863/g.97379  ORF Transcript_33863/g.97379 Transcript_33863/m.97379 type:complete len:292 (+) Transcript_33863:693-1568(+)
MFLRQPPQLAQEVLGVLRRHEHRGPMLDRHELVQLHLRVPCAGEAILSEGEGVLVGAVPTLLVLPRLVLQHHLDHLLPLVLLPRHVVAKRGVRTHGGDKGAAPDFLVHLHGLPEGGCRLRPLHVGLGVGRAPRVHHQAQRRELHRHGRHAVGYPQRLTHIAADGAEVRPEADEEHAARKALLRPIQPLVGLRECFVGAWLSEEGSDVDLVANEDHHGEWRQQAVLLPTSAEKIDGGVAVALHAGAPGRRLHEEPGQQGDDEVEDAQREQRCGPHEAPLGPLVGQGFGLEQA